MLGEVLKKLFVGTIPVWQVFIFENLQEDTLSVQTEEALDYLSTLSHNYASLLVMRKADCQAQGWFYLWSSPCMLLRRLGQDFTFS